MVKIAFVIYVFMKYNLFLLVIDFLRPGVIINPWFSPCYFFISFLDNFLTGACLSIILDM